MRRAPVAIEGHQESKGPKGLLVFQDRVVRRARKVTWVSQVWMAWLESQGLQGSRVRQDSRASSGHQDQGENQAHQGRPDHQELLDHLACRTLTVQATSSSRLSRLLLGQRDTRKMDANLSSEVICTKTFLEEYHPL